MDVSVVRGFSGILSRESAVGMVMAQGNIGTTLSPYASQMRLFMSTNGGYSWSEVSGLVECTKGNCWYIQFGSCSEYKILLETSY